MSCAFHQGKVGVVMEGGFSQAGDADDGVLLTRENEHGRLDIFGGRPEGGHVLVGDEGRFGAKVGVEFFGGDDRVRAEEQTSGMGGGANPGGGVPGQHHAEEQRRIEGQNHGQSIGKGVVRYPGGDQHCGGQIIANVFEIPLRQCAAHAVAEENGFAFVPGDFVPQEVQVVIECAKLNGALRGGIAVSGQANGVVFPAQFGEPFLPEMPAPRAVEHSVLEQERGFVFALGRQVTDPFDAVFDNVLDGVRFAAFGFFEGDAVCRFVGPFEQGFAGVIFENVPKHPDLLADHVSGSDGGEGFEEFFHGGKK